MNLLTIAWKSIRQRALASALTGLSVALGVMLMVAVLVIHSIVGQVFSQNSIGYDLIVGPRGSELTLVLSAIYRIRPPIDNVPYLYYEEIAADPRVEHAIPLAFGDVTEQGAFPIVGTTSQFFEIEYAPNRKFMLRGEPMAGPFDAIIGAEVARKNGWDIGTKFKLIHGGADVGHVHDEEFTVVGVLRRTGTANDKTAFVNLRGFYMIEGHDKPASEALAQLKKYFPEREDIQKLTEKDIEAKNQHGHDHGHDHSHGDHHHHESHDIPDEMKEVTAILLTMKGNDTADRSFRAIAMLNEIKQDLKPTMAVNPVVPMRELMTGVVGNVQTALVIMTALIIIVSGIGIFVSIYNSMSDRRKEIAIMRALGARRQTVFAIILAESFLLCLGGGLLGILLGHGLVYLAGPFVEARSGILIDPLAFDPLELVLIPGLIVLASLIGFIPGMTAYRTDVARTLAD